MLRLFRFKSITYCLLSVVCCLLITGCQDKYPNQDLADPRTSEIQVWMAGNQKEQQFLEAMGREFVSIGQFEGISVKVVSFPSREMLEEVFLSRMAEGRGPDIIFLDGDWIWRNTRKLLAREGDDTFTPEWFRETFVRAAHEILIQRNKIYGVPMGVDTLALYYNLDHAQDRLLDRNKPGVTWAEIQKDVTLLTRKDNSKERFKSSGLAFGRADNIHYVFDILENIILQQGVAFFSPDETKVLFHSSSGSVAKSQNAAAEAVAFYTSFADERYKHQSWNAYLARAESEDKNFETFVEGKTSMVFGYLTDHDRIKQLINAKKGRRDVSAISEKTVGVTFFPQVDAPQGQETRKLIGRVPALGVVHNTRHPDLAWRYLKFVTRKENIEIWLKDVVTSPPRVDLVTQYRHDPIKGIFAQQAKFARSNHMPLPKKTLRAHFEQMVQSVNDRKGNAETILNRIGKEVETWLQHQIKMTQALKPPAHNQ